ncbi:efflux transporter outer membrane subunit [Sphingomonas azotifigens]|uniref:efflux transporter outer membrane subunit n=1 Tax=Sphingomonas azotifigens TaxID=330920 RepID=UPI000A03512D|nr:efflux transporter outer membrane subunit [Sphingomonas azotifigens]
MMRVSLFPLLVLPLAGCATAGRDFRAPAPPASQSYPLAKAEQGPGDGQRFVAGAAVPQRWWTLFGNPALDTLVEEALRANPDVATAEARLRQARAQASVVEAARLPTADLSLQGEKTRTSRSLSGVLADDKRYLYSLSTTQLSINYPLDLFGGLKRRGESARATAEVQAHRLAAARLTVATNTALAVIRLASIRDRIDALGRSIELRRQLLDLFRRRQALGEVGTAELEAQRTALARAEGMLPPLRKAEAHERATIDTLLGREPGAVSLPTITIDSLHLPQDLPLSLPAAIVRQRPDILAAQAQLHAASADVGVAIAVRLPAVTLSGNVGGRAIEFDRMFAGSNPFWTIIGGLTQPIFRGGALRRQQEDAQAAFDASKAQYRGVVLAALADVSDALLAVREDGEAVRAARTAHEAAEHTLALVSQQVRLGASGTLEVMNAATASAEAQTELIAARSLRLADTVALFQALGGGYSVDAT